MGDEGGQGEAEAQSDGRYQPPGWLTAFIIVVITLLWAGTFLAQIFRPEYHPPSGIHAVFLGMLGVIFGRQIVKGLHRE